MKLRRQWGLYPEVEEMSRDSYYLNTLYTPKVLRKFKYYLRICVYDFHFTFKSVHECYVDWSSAQKHF